MKKVAFILFYALMMVCQTALAQQLLLSGKVVDAETGKPIEYASILLGESGLWAITNEKGIFTIKGVGRLPGFTVVQ